MGRREREGRAMTFRSFLYLLARLLGDLNAVSRGRVGRRMGRRVAGRISGHVLRKLFK